MNESELIPQFNSETNSKTEIFEIPELPEHKFITNRITTIETRREQGQFIKNLVVIKHVLPNGKVDLKNSRIYLAFIHDNNIHNCYRESF